MTSPEAPIVLERWVEDVNAFRVVYLPRDRFVEILSVREHVIRVALGHGLARWWSGAKEHLALRVWARARSLTHEGTSAIAEVDWVFADTPAARAVFGLPAKA